MLVRLTAALPTTPMKEVHQRVVHMLRAVWVRLGLPFPYLPWPHPYQCKRADRPTDQLHFVLPLWPVLLVLLMVGLDDLWKDWRGTDGLLRLLRVILPLCYFLQHREQQKVKNALVQDQWYVFQQLLAIRPLGQRHKIKRRRNLQQDGRPFQGVLHRGHVLQLDHPLLLELQQGDPTVQVVVVERRN